MKHLSILSIIVSLAAGSAHADWRQFRGPNGSGYIKAEGIPTTLEKDKNVAWSLELPGKGLSSPIVVGDKVFVTASSGADQAKLHVFCFNASDGKTVWERQFWSTGRTMCHSKTSVAAPTPVSDGENVLALFSSNDLFCLDLEGNVKWLRGLTNDYPNASNSLGLASSPVIANGIFIAQVENDSDSFVAGIDLKYGKNLWKITRKKQANWTSPLVLNGSDEKALVALQSGWGVDVISPATGQTVWSFKGGASTIPSSAADANNVLYVPSNGLTAIKAGADGAAEELWQTGAMRPGTASPLVIGDRVYVINNSGVLNCGSVEDGKRLWRIRLKGPFGASPIATDTHLYAFNEEGLVQVISLDGEEGKIVSQLELGEMIQCTPAIAGGAIYVRSNSRLWKLSG